MGYRNYIAPITKVEYEKIKNFTLEELYEYKNEPLPKDDGYIGVYNIPDKAIYELGKYVEEFDQSLFKPVFLNKELQDHMSDECDFYLVGKEFVKAIIDRYEGKIKEYYNKMVKPFYNDERCWDDKEFLKSIKRDCDDDLNMNYTFDWSKITQAETNALFEMLEHTRNMRSEWCRSTPYNLENGDAVTTSWKYEYELFELVRIYKHFDWENNYIVYYGY